MASPCPPRTIALTSSLLHPTACAMKCSNLAESSSPAIPKTLSDRNPVRPFSCYHDDEYVMPAAACDTMPALRLMRSSRDIPGRRASPHVTTTTSEPLTSP